MYMSIVARLFTFVDESALNASTFVPFRALLNNFNPVLGQEDPDVTEETNAFLTELIATEAISILHGCLLDWGKTCTTAFPNPKMVGNRVYKRFILQTYLVHSDYDKIVIDSCIIMADSPCISRMRTFTEIVTGDLNSFADDLRQWWFTKYSRSGGVLDSSGFEHVFQVCVRGVPATETARASMD